MIPKRKYGLSVFQREIERTGWSEGRNVHIDYRFAPAGVQAQVLARELVALRPDVILSQASPATAALQRETRTIPIVFVGVTDPIGSGFVSSLAQPGGTMTGFLLFETGIIGKWLAMLREIAPHLTRAAIVINPRTAPYHNYFLRGAAAASSLAIEMAFTPIGDTKSDIGAGHRDVCKRAERWAGLPAPIQIQLRTAIFSSVSRPSTAYPRLYSDRHFVAAGGLVCYSTDRAEQYRLAGVYVDRILRGAKPADLPAQVPTKYRTVLNLKTAKTLGLAVPPTLLVAADEVIE